MSALRNPPMPDHLAVAEQLAPSTVADQPATLVADASSARRRLVGVDIARALALIGMFTRHVTISDADGASSTGWVAWLFEESTGRASVMFFVLSGVSLSMVARRGSRSALPAVLRRRGLLLLTGGILLTISMWGGSILQHYGVAFLLAPWLLRLGRRGLACVTVAGLVGGPISLLFLPDYTEGITTAWSGTSGSWFIGQAWDLVVEGTYPMVIWIGFFTLGMVLGRLDLQSRRTARTMAAAGVVATLAFGGAANFAADQISTAGAGSGQPVESASPDNSGPGPVVDAAGSVLTDPMANLSDADISKLTETQIAAKLAQSEAYQDAKFADDGAQGETGNSGWRSLADTTGHSAKLGWTLQTPAIAVAILGFCLLIPRRLSKVLTPLAILGSMSLTAYIVHILLVNDVWDHWINDADLSVVTKEWFFAGLVATMIAACMVFHRFSGTGPLERLVKHFTQRSSD